MRIAIFISGHVRTLFYKFHENISLIKERIPDCKVDVFYSFWDDPSRSDRINDPWHYKACYEQPKIDVDTINSYFLNGDASNVKGEIESSNKMKSVMENSFFSQPHISSQYYKKNRVVEKYYDDHMIFMFRLDQI